MGAERLGLIRPGLLSVTFRALSAARIVVLAAEAGLAAVEWGGEVHVPHGDLTAARAVRHVCNDHGLAVSAYGSYYSAGASPKKNPPIGAVLDTAMELGTTTVRVWAGTQASSAADAAERAGVAARLAEVCDHAATRGLTVATEFHAGTLTDDADSCVGLLAAANRPNLRTLWQPPNGMPAATALGGLQRVLPQLSHLHVFHWWPDDRHRQPLSDGADRWRAYLRAAAGQSGMDGQLRYASLEFIRGDDVDQFRRDAATLRAWLSGHSGS